MLKVGIVGMGGMGRHHARRYPQIPNARITAIADIVPERLDADNVVQINLSAGTGVFDFSDVARYSEGLDLIKDADVDVVDICLPTYLHAEYSIAAMEAGHHVICEKPMALRAEDAERMAVASERTGQLLMVAQVVRFWPEFEFLREQIEQQTYGALLSLNMRRVGSRPGWSPDNWFLNPALSGGAILDLHIHDVDYANAVLGKPDRIYATGRMSKAAKAYDVIHACFSYADGPQVHMHAGWSAAQVPFTSGFEAWFDEALIKYDQGKLRVLVGPDAEQPEVPDFSGVDGYRNEIAYFLSCVETKSQPARCTPASSRDSMLLISAELASMDSGDVVKL